MLAVESQTFFKWRVHLKATKRLLSPDPASEEYDYSDTTEPNLFYAASSAHLSQSDFGVLFPWVGRKVFSAEEPERVMKLNVRAILQVLRNRNIEIGKTCAEDMELSDTAKVDTVDDELILGRNEEVRGWNWLSTDVADLKDVDVDEGEEMKQPSEEGELLKGEGEERLEQPTVL